MEFLEIAHFNDVYEIEESGDGKGPARFYTALKTSALNSLLLFSGDCFSPSHGEIYAVSERFRGSQMVAVLNRLQVKCATIGNHDLDFGLVRLRELIAETDFPWVQSNLRESDGSTLGGAVQHLILQWQGWQIGLLGLAEAEWLDIVGACGKDLIYEDFCQAATREAQHLRAEGCDIVIALTHMRFNNELLLAERCPDVDLILGGHDHFSKAELHYACPIIKSGSDFEEFTAIRVSKTHALHLGRRGLFFTWTKHPITTAVQPDSEMLDIVQRFVGDRVRARVLANFAKPLDCRFTIIRSQESEIGNLLSDVVRMHFRCDVVLINAGHVRLNGFIPAGKFTDQDLQTLLSVQDDLSLVRVTGAQLLRALEEGVSKFPALEGRFPMLSGARLQLDFTQSPRM